MSIPEDVLQNLTAVFANALKTAVQEVQGGANAAPEGAPKAAAFTIGEYRTADCSSVEDYFKRFDWALNLSRIREVDYAAYARVHIGSELNNALKFLGDEQVNTLTIAEPEITKVQQLRLSHLISRFDDVFGESAGKLAGPPATLHLKPGATPVFAKAREIPFALRDLYAKEIDKKILSGLYQRVESSEWASTTHVVAKKNGKIRITDYLFHKMKGATIFCHLDITDAYSHLTVDDDFSHALTLNTPTHGLIRPTRAVYGAANIPAIWQRRMETVLQGLPNVVNFYDDILIHAANFEEMLKVLEKTLNRLKINGLCLNRSKCVFGAPAVEFLGHKIDAAGVHKSDRHVETIRDAKKPANAEELQLFLGKATYYSAFIPNLSSRDSPLRDMLLQDNFKWTTSADAAYEEIKNALISPQVLMQYDPDLPLLLATDASSTGLGAVLSHRLSDGAERPIAYASRTLSATEQRYPQIDKEALAIIWAVQKFFMYLYARHWTLITDHKPLSQILHPEKSLPTLCISRMANYADFLGNFDFEVVFKKTKENANADYCSRVVSVCPVNLLRENHAIAWDEQLDEFDCFMLRQIEQLPINAQRVAQETRKDEELGKILRALEDGISLERLGFRSPQINYKTAAGCLVYEHRVIIPRSLQATILKDLHVGHLGIVKMKGLARSFVYWPGIDSDIERTAKMCYECAKNANDPPKFRDHVWEYPKAPWERIHIDFAGPLLGVMLLIITDAYSKWIEVKVTVSMTASATITLFDELFSAYGVPTTVVSDNGTNFTSTEFKTFLRMAGVKYHKLTAPYHPSSNGQAERSVQTVKNALKAMNSTRNNIQRNLNEFLRRYRRAPHSTTGQPPCQLFLGRNIRTCLDLVLPADPSTKIDQQQKSKMDSSFREFKVSQPVYFRSYNPRMAKWVPGIISARLGDLHYEVDYKGKKCKRHVDQLQNNASESVSESEKSPCMGDKPDPYRFQFSSESTPTGVTIGSSSQEQSTSTPISGSNGGERAITPPVSQDTGAMATPAAPRRSTRTRRPRIIFSPDGR
ncbi:uncharacterized protein K02A2.6-like [Sabethes cyaneus]|uniref:uncharacterized protein K02A2.6-like n=1 Tax=Sabethes cyaneus TaxID=53552 RepID=UPI00237DE2C1|nr:uncharacterized protein K02A2.6-like [Sabethes cyaneus]